MGHISRIGALKVRLHLQIGHFRGKTLGVTCSIKCSRMRKLEKLREKETSDSCSPSKVILENEIKKKKLTS